MIGQQFDDTSDAIKLLNYVANRNIVLQKEIDELRSMTESGEWTENRSVKISIYDDGDMICGAVKSKEELIWRWKPRRDPQTGEVFDACVACGVEEGHIFECPYYPIDGVQTGYSKDDF